jgi:hypothetical protein
MSDFGCGPYSKNFPELIMSGEQLQLFLHYWVKDDDDDDDDGSSDNNSGSGD